jgi:hypothetical protein
MAPLQWNSPGWFWSGVDIPIRSWPFWSTWCSGFLYHFLQPTRSSTWSCLLGIVQYQDLSKRTRVTGQKTIIKVQANLTVPLQVEEPNIRKDLGFSSMYHIQTLIWESFSEVTFMDAPTKNFEGNSGLGLSSHMYPVQKCYDVNF